MATYSTPELAHKVLTMFERHSAGQDRPVLTRQDLLVKWPKGFSHTELTAAIEHACDRGWLELTGAGFRITETGVAQSLPRQPLRVKGLSS